jgi:hypothetical protein
MDATTYTHKLRRFAVVSWLTPMFILLGFVWAGVIPYYDYLPFIALAVGSVPIWVYTRRNRATCGKCGGTMKITAGFPRMIYRCRKCGDEVNTGIHPDY